ncbi:cytochrome P460 family protein [Sediminimonas sp.]|uniref:cytochrome P460 family protein n=1 Tax=Sediminimonas sp. TaxID=2823379 RepID=UPI0025DA14B1|nr:cytochrome P460 family protein [Sediminimonas sp.]
MTRNFTAALIAATLLGGAALAQDMKPPFGTDKDTAYADMVWQTMNDIGFAGPDMVRTFPYQGIAPHGKMLETLYTTATVDGHEGALVIKRNYGPEGVSADEVLVNPGKHLGAVTVMFKREDGYDADNQNWFWAKYLPDGSLDKNPKGMQLAGRVAKGMDAGCIACHAAAPGDDYLFTTDHVAN